MFHKPVILWTCDVRNWAYWNRVTTMQAALPQYEHRVVMGDCCPPSLLVTAVAMADIVICQGVKSIDRVRAWGAAWDKMIVRIDSVRVDCDGQYYDIFVKPQGNTDG